MKQKLMLFIALLLPCFLFAQQIQTSIKGRVIGSVSKEPVAGVIVELNGENRQTRTDSKGFFNFENVSQGKDVLMFNSVNITPQRILIEIEKGVINDVGNIEVIELQTNEDLSLVGVIDEVMVDDDVDNSSQDVSSTVILSNDVYLNRAAYQLSPVRFRVRGYDSYYQQKYINGVSFNDQLRGVFNYASIGALNDMTRNGDVVNYNRPSTFTYGSIGGAENINMRAGSYAPGTKATLTYTNRIYYLRGMVTYATGLRPDGWAFTASLGGRYSHEGNVDGTFYRNFSYALSAEKQWKGGKHSLSLVTFGSPVARGQQSASYQEVYDLTGNNLYNPNWGYQNGKKRNAKVVKAFDPTVIASYIWKISDDVTLTTGLGYHYGRYGNTALNWYNGMDPRPDYYRQLPSFTDQMQTEFLWRRNDTSYTQIDWDKLYRQNYLSVREGEGDAIYMVEERRSDLYETSLNSTLNARLSNRMNLVAGIGLRSTISSQFKTVDDLLGAKYVRDIDKFAEQGESVGTYEEQQSDLNRPGRKVYEGGVFGYNFNLNIYSANAWLLNQYRSSKLDFYYGFKVTYTDFQRDGKMRNGHYPTNSYGKGVSHSFTDMALKGGLTYKFNGRHFITANVSYGTEAPLPNDAYISPRISDKTIDNLKSGRVFSADVNYIFSTPSLTGRIGLFQTNFYDQLERGSYYHSSMRTFVNHVLSGVNRIHRGLELGATYKLDNHWSFDLAGTVSEYYYNNNPMGVINSENGRYDNIMEKVYMKNVYVGGTPQVAGTFGIRYFIDYWFLGANVNGFGRNYIEAAPLRRVASNYAEIDPTNPEQLQAYKTLTTQEKLAANYTVDLSVGKIFYLRNRNSVNLNLAVYNVFNKKDIATGGYEQGRTDASYPERFASKYYYMQGINCFLNVSYRF